jgi:hypothetical protein
MSSSDNPLQKIASAVPCLDLWQPRDWPHRRGDEINIELHSFPLTEGSPGRRTVACETCSSPCQCIHDNVLCWRCKSAFCLQCILNPNELLTIPMSQILKNGFGKCKNCTEPLRSIALIDVFRNILEAGGSVLHENNPSTSGFKFEGKGTSLVQEAEEALGRGQEFQEKQNREQAILEFTHAINAINYLASASSALRLILRAHDILLIAHCLRAELEKNQMLASAIIVAYPKASVKTSSSSNSDDQSWYLSKSAYKSLYYPLPATLMVGAGGSGFFLMDLRSQSKGEAYASPKLRKQITLSGVNPALVLAGKDSHPHCDGYDPQFDSLNGTWKGVWSYVQLNPVSQAAHFGKRSAKPFTVMQFVRVFTTKLAAAEYTRVMFKNKKVGEEGPPLNARDKPSLVKLFKKKAKEFGVTGLQQTHVLQGTSGLSGIGQSFSFVTAVESISTKVFVVVPVDGGEEIACHIVAKAVAYLDRQLREYRSSSPSSVQEAPFPPSDLTVCAFCGKDDSAIDLKACSRCKLARYCSAECQKKHWMKKGEFGHNRFCKAAST